LEACQKQVAFEILRPVDDFKKTIDSIIEDSSKGSKNLIDKLIGDSVQLFDTLIPISSNSFAVQKVNKDKGKPVA
jgi:hypothetical protein